jgi:hypothetical protein
LAAILAPDVAGDGRVMGNDEERQQGRFSMRYGPILALVAIIFASALSAASAEVRVAQVASITGSYSVSGTNPDSSTYSGSVVVSQLGGNRYRFDWSIAGNQTFTGTGALNGNTISVDWGQDAPVIYQVGSNGVLNGTWANGRGIEVLIPSR